MANRIGIGRTVAAGLTIALAATLAVGCTPQPELSDEVPTETAAPEPTDPPEPPPAPVLPSVPGDEVLTVTASATAPNGSVLDLRLTAHYPHAWNSAEGEAIAAYLEAQGDESGIVSDREELAENATTLQIIDIVATLRAGTPAWPAERSVRLALGPDTGETVVGLPIDRSEHGFPDLNGPGSGTAIALLPDTPGAEPEPGNWANRWTYYGFRNDSDARSGVLGDCVVDVTELGRGSAGTEYWDNLWEYGRLDCMVGIGH
jgi:hypothetical protein